MNPLRADTSNWEWRSRRRPLLSSPPLSQEHLYRQAVIKSKAKLTKNSQQLERIRRRLSLKQWISSRSRSSLATRKSGWNNQELWVKQQVWRISSQTYWRQSYRRQTYRRLRVTRMLYKSLMKSSRNRWLMRLKQPQTTNQMIIKSK